MFDRVVLGGVGRVMGNANGNPKFISQGLQRLLEQVMTRMVAPPTITEEQEFLGLGIVNAAVSEPPAPQAGAAKFRGVMASPDREIADIADNIVQAMRNGDAIRG